MASKPDKNKNKYSSDVREQLMLNLEDADHILSFK